MVIAADSRKKIKSVWIESALDDLESALIWVSDYDPNAALKLDDEVAQVVSRLEKFPFSGRSGRVDGTREAIVGNYALVYRVAEEQIEILRFIHGAMQYPPSSLD